MALSHKALQRLAPVSLYPFLPPPCAQQISKAGGREGESKILLYSRLKQRRERGTRGGKSQFFNKLAQMFVKRREGERECSTALHNSPEKLLGKETYFGTSLGQQKTETTAADFFSPFVLKIL